MVPCPAKNARLIAEPRASTAEKYSSAEVHSASIPSSASARRRSAAAGPVSGNSENPQDPFSSEVTPWYTRHWAEESISAVMSECVCTSMNPGVTVAPVASRTVAPHASMFRPIRSIRSPDTRMSAWRGRVRGRPLITVPPRISSRFVTTVAFRVDRARMNRSLLLTPLDYRCRLRVVSNRAIPHGRCPTPACDPCRRPA